ncbi:hypothetical protein ACT8ZV_19440, partial [Nocardioides sp. MAHUQ-72]|uniref:hypothetical protein n=1 Tax=unclassified Nocardioides TaxID=2615069 RepID=UPI00360A039D
ADTSRRALRVLGHALRRGLPPGVRLEVSAGRASRGTCLEPPDRVRAAVRAACLAGYRRAPVDVASGGSIRAVDVLARVLGTPPVLLGLGPADDGAHGPDEHLDLRDWPAAVDTHVVLLAELASRGRKPYARTAPAPVASSTVESRLGAWGPRRATSSGVT